MTGVQTCALPISLRQSQGHQPGSSLGKRNMKAASENDSIELTTKPSHQAPTQAGSVEVRPLGTGSMSDIICET